MSQADQSFEWYLARDGQQHGPISAAEMSKIIEMGYLLPTDLVWRQGLADWQAASVAFPPKAAPETPAPPVTPQPPSRSPVAPSTKGPESDATSAAPRDRQPQSKEAPGGAGSRDPAAGAGDPREIIAKEAARREEAARRARKQFRAPGGQPQTGGAGPGAQPGGPRQPMGAQPHHPRTEPRGGPRPIEPAPIQAADTSDERWDDDAPRRRLPRLLVASLILLVLIGGGGYALHATGQLDPLIGRISSAAMSENGATPVVQAKPDSRQRQAASYSDDPARVDSQFQQAALWKLLKGEFPDWYQERIRETARLKTEGKTDTEIAQHLAEQLVRLRRKHVADALAASPRNLKSVASSFLDNLERLSKHSVDACYGFISQGETNPLIVELTRASEHTPALQKQAAAIFSAIAEGRKTPARHASPTREDYDQLAAQLAKRGWSPHDLQLFSDARSLARAAPDRVCKMVQDWFAAQLAVPDEEVQVRLLMEALKPVVAG